MEKQMKNDFDDYMDYMKLYPISFTDATQIKFKSDSDELFREHLKLYLNRIYGSEPCSNCLAEDNYLIKKLLLEQLQCGRPLRKGGIYNECKTEVQEAKEENRAAQESKDTD